MTKIFHQAFFHVAVSSYYPMLQSHLNFRQLLAHVFHCVFLALRCSTGAGNMAVERANFYASRLVPQENFHSEVRCPSAQVVAFDALEHLPVGWIHQ